VSTHVSYWRKLLEVNHEQRQRLGVAFLEPFFWLLCLHLDH
jgi:hypothetical protein